MRHAGRARRARAAFAAGQAGHGPLAARAAFALAGLALAAAVLVVLLALRPRLGSAGFCRWAAMSESDVRLSCWREDTDRIGGFAAVEAARTAASAEVETLHALSVIAMAKYRRLRLAGDLAAAGVVLLAAAAVAGVIAVRPQEHAREFPGCPESVAQARQFAAAVAGGCPAADAVVLAASELAANAVRWSGRARRAARTPCGSR